MVWQNIQSFPTWQTGEHQNQMFIPMFQRSSKYTLRNEQKQQKSNSLHCTVDTKKIKYEVGEDMSSFPNGKVKFLEFHYFSKK